MRHPVSTWQLAAGGLQRKWKGIKQRTAWRYKTLKDRNTAIVFSPDTLKEKEIHLKPRSHRYANDPLACHNVLLRVSTESLNGILSATSPQDSSQYCKTMTGFMLHSCSPAMRASILDVIAYKRVQDVSITNRAVVIRAIQRCLLSPLHMEKTVLYAAACHILKSTFGHDLTLLKEQIHTNDVEILSTEESILSQQPSEFETDPTSFIQASELPPSGDLTQLLYGNRNLSEVVQVMQHIAIQASIVQQEDPSLVKVISDLDDTLYPGWKDSRYPLHHPYPGVSELYTRLSHTFIEKPCMTFLTARPRGWLSMGRYLTMQHLHTIGIPHAIVLNGTVKGLVSIKKIVEAKVDNFTRFATLFPEFQFVFFGDSGQGDALLASKLLTLFPSQVIGTFIHDITPEHALTGDGQTKSFYATQGIEFFSTYVGASIAAYHKGLLKKEDVFAIQEKAKVELASMSFHSMVGGSNEKMQRQQELEEDCRVREKRE